MFCATFYEEKHREMANKWNINSAKVKKKKIKKTDEKEET